MVAPLTQKAKRSRFARICRIALGVAFVGICPIVVLHAIAVETFHIPSGSMAPALHGNHRVCVCPNCGHSIAIGRAGADRDGMGESRFYRKTFCPNCGTYPIRLADASEVPGDRIQVNKSAYLLRAPWRFEIIVFRLFGTYFIKRLLGLPGEEIFLHDGDVYVNGALLRKTLAEAREMRVLIFDHERAPKGGGWQGRWEPNSAGAGPITLDGRLTPATITYRNFLLSAGKCEPIRDEYAYNGGVHADSECVHDFLFETEAMPTSESGTVALRLCDGRNWVEVVMPIGAKQPVRAFSWPMDAPSKKRLAMETKQTYSLQPNKRQRVEMGFVDRRISLAVDSKVWLQADLPAVKERNGVDQPFQAQADGCQVILHGFRLYRDVHYGQQGTNAVRGKAVRLGANQYFMLGDNSPNSADSRFWPDEGRVNASALVGSVLRVRRN